MSPEQARSPRDVDHRTDLYSVGAILYEMLSGRTPYTAESGEFTEILFKIFTTEPEPLARLRPESARGARRRRAPRAAARSRRALRVGDRDGRGPGALRRRAERAGSRAPARGPAEPDAGPAALAHAAGARSRARPRARRRRVPSPAATPSACDPLRPRSGSRREAASDAHLRVARPNGANRRPHRRGGRGDRRQRGFPRPPRARPRRGQDSGRPAGRCGAPPASALVWPALPASATAHGLRAGRAPGPRGGAVAVAVDPPRPAAWPRPRLQGGSSPLRGARLPVQSPPQRRRLRPRRSLPSSAT